MHRPTQKHAVTGAFSCFGHADILEVRYALMRERCELDAQRFRCDDFLVVARHAKQILVVLGAFKKQMQVVFPRKPDPAVRLQAV